MKTRTVWILTGLAVGVAVVCGVLLLGPSFYPRKMCFEETKGLTEGGVISVKSRAEVPGVRKGDAFFYVVEVWYNPGEVAEIDRTSLEKNINLKPFEIREAIETDVRLDSSTRVYRRRYEIMLLEGRTNYLHKLPSVGVRYRLRNSAQFVEKTHLPEPIFVSSRLPATLPNLGLRPLKGRVEDVSRRDLPWILFALGGILVILGIVDLGWRVLPHWKEIGKKQRKVATIGISDAYRSLLQKAAEGREPGLLLYQMDHILRIAFVQRRICDWLEEPDPDKVSPDVRQSFNLFVEKSRKLYASQQITKEEAEEALGQLKEILGFYWGRAKVRSWKE